MVKDESLAELQAVDLAQLAHTTHLVMAERYEAAAVADRCSELGRRQRAKQID
jgi:hypothetical protein